MVLSGNPNPKSSFEWDNDDLVEVGGEMGRFLVERGFADGLAFGAEFPSVDGDFAEIGDLEGEKRGLSVVLAAFSWLLMFF